MNSSYAYFTRIIPALSVVGVVTLLFVALVVAPYGKSGRGEQHAHSTTSQLLLSLYTVLLHIPSVLFPARLCWALGDVTQKMKETVGITDKSRRRKTQNVRKGQLTVLYPSPVFVIIVPAYKEAVETLEETLRVLASHSHARHAYHIYLAMESKEEKSDVKAANLIHSFEKSFYKMSFTVHPFNLPGEAQGKSSNESWAAKQAFDDYPDEIKKNVIMTVMDADTHLSARYFAQVAQYHADFPETCTETIYVPPLVFDRNVTHVPLPVRTSDIVWAGAGISNLYSGSKISIPTSVYSLSMVLAENVGGWDTDPGSIGEDMHMYLKCFFALSGHLTVKVVYAAASQCNVSSELTGFRGFWDGLGARYKQALRHMWGAVDTGYAVRQALAMVRKRYNVVYGARSSSYGVLEVAEFAKDSLLASMSTVCGFNWAALEKSSAKPRASIAKPSLEPTPIYSKPIHALKVCLLFNSLFEAHFLPVHLALILAATTVYENVAGELIPHGLSLALRFSETCRWIGWGLICVYFYRYERYHRLCFDLREEEMKKAGLLEIEHAHNGFSRKVWGRLGFLEACLFPIGGFLFGSIPACQAVLSHVFTDRLTYHVSLKPQFIRAWESQKQPTTTASTSTNRPKALRTKSSRPISSHVRCPSDTWRKQAVAHFDHFTSALAFNQPVKQKD